MSQFLSFVRKEFLHILRDPRSLLILLLMPLLLVLILGLIIRNDVTDIRFVVLDPSRDVCTRQITDRLIANPYFVFKGNVETEAEATACFRRGETDLAIVFGTDFADRLQHTGDTDLQILSDGSEPNQSGVRVVYAEQVVRSALAEMQSAPTGGIKVSTRLLFNPQSRSELNFVPGVVGIILMLICCMMTSVAIVREREMGTMEVLLASPLPVLGIVVAKLAPYFAISLFNLATILLITHWLMDVPVVGSLALYLAVCMLYMLVSLLLGLFISTLVGTQLAAMLISLLLIVPSIYLSDMIFSLAGMPAAARAVSHIVPARWFIAASRKVMVEGVGANYILKELGVLAAAAVALLLLSWKLFKTRLE